MRVIDRYLFHQFLGPTLLATLALSVVALLAEALTAIGVLLNQRQSLWVFVRVICLAMPQLIVLILPVAVLVAGVLTVNRLRRDNEVAICYASGYSRWRVISSPVRLSAIIAAVSLVLTLWVQPLSYRALRDTLEDVRSDLVTTFITPGQFSHPAPGMTVYAQSIDAAGNIRNLFIDRRLDDGRDTTISARDGRLQRRNGTVVLIMRRGESQELAASGALNFLSFDDYVLDLTPLLSTKPSVRYKMSDRYMHELLFSARDSAWEQANIGAMLAEANSRIAAPLYVIAYMLLALATILGAGFSRLGYGGRIATASAVALVARTLGFAVQSICGAHPLLNVLQYAPPVLVGAVSVGMLFRAGVTRAASDGASAPLGAIAGAKAH